MTNKHQNLLNDVRELLIEISRQESTISAMGNKSYKKIGLIRLRLDAFLADVDEVEFKYLNHTERRPRNSFEVMKIVQIGKLLHTATRGDNDDE